VLERVLEKEQAMFSNKPSDNVRSKTTSAPHHFRFDKKWEEHWQFFLDHMVYQSEKTSFEQAIMAAEKLMVICDS
jgi:hypothetical protein